MGILNRNKKVDTPASAEIERRLVEIRNQRKMADYDRLFRLKRTRDIYAGNFVTVFPDQFETNDDPKVNNIVQTGLDDTGNLVSESMPIMRCDAQSEDVKAIANANLREAIAAGYWFNNDYVSWLPAQLGMDLAGAGAAFLLVWTDEYSDYPQFLRLDPASCFPDFYNDHLLDLMVTTEMPVTQAKKLFPDIDIDSLVTDAHTNVVELIDYYEHDKITQVLAVRKIVQPGAQGYQTPYTTPEQSVYAATDARIISQIDNPFKEIPVAWAKRETFDGKIRGIYDQIPNTLLTQNRIVEVMLDYADQLAYAPILAQNVANINDEPGPKTIYQILEGGSMTRLAPAGQSPQLWNMLEYLERQTRGGAMQPATRSGEVGVSQGSAAFVSSTMGQLTSTVRGIQRHLSRLMSRANELAFKVDEKYKNFEKPLIQPVEGKNTYVPSKAIKGVYRNRVVFGAGAGLDLINRSVMLLQDLGARLISRDTARENKDYIVNPNAESIKVERETMKDAFLQRAASEGDFGILMEILAEQAKGVDIVEAVRVVQERQQAAAQAQVEQATAPTAPEVQALAAAPPEAAAEENVALQKGATTQQQDPDLPLPPSTQIIVAPPRN